MRYDRKKVIQFRSLQSKDGEQALEQVNQLFGKPAQTVIFFDGSNYFIESDAIIQLSAHFDFPWNLIRIFRIIPKFIRDKIYRFVAKNRYQWFGKSDQCMVPER